MTTEIDSAIDEYNRGREQMWIRNFLNEPLTMYSMIVCVVCQMENRPESIHVRSALEFYKVKILIIH